MKPPAGRPSSCAPSGVPNRNPLKPYPPPAPWNGSPRRTNRAEWWRCLRRSLYARSPPIAPRAAQPRIATDPLARSRQSPVGGRAFLDAGFARAAFEDIAQPTAATTLAAAATVRVLFAPQQMG